MSKRHPKMRLEWTDGASVEVVCDREIPPTWDAAMTAAFTAYHAIDNAIPNAAPDARPHDDVAEALAARDAEWRAAVERVRREVPDTIDGACQVCGQYSSYCTCFDHNAALDALLAAMEVPHDGQ